MGILTVQDFNQIPYNIPDANTTDPHGNLSENLQLVNYIKTKTNDVLPKILRGGLSDVFLLGLENLPDVWSGKTHALDDLIMHEDQVWRSLVANNAIKPVVGLNWVKVPNEWLMLLNGTTYGIGYTWGGLKKLLIPYIYASWLRDTFDDHTKVGIVYRTAENATVISPAKRIARAYNDFANRLHSLPVYVNHAYTLLGHYNTLTSFNPRRYRYLDVNEFNI